MNSKSLHWFTLWISWEHITSYNSDSPAWWLCVCVCLVLSVCRLRAVPPVPLGPCSVFQGPGGGGVSDQSEEEEEPLSPSLQGQEGGWGGRGGIPGPERGGQRRREWSLHPCWPLCTTPQQKVCVYIPWGVFIMWWKLVQNIWLLVNISEKFGLSVFPCRWSIFMRCLSLQAHMNLQYLYTCNSRKIIIIVLQPIFEVWPSIFTKFIYNCCINRFIVFGYLGQRILQQTHRVPLLRGQVNTVISSLPTLHNVRIT